MDIFIQSLQAFTFNSILISVIIAHIHELVILLTLSLEVSVWWSETLYWETLLNHLFEITPLDGCTEASVHVQEDSETFTDSKQRPITTMMKLRIVVCPS